MATPDPVSPAEQIVDPVLCVARLGRGDRLAPEVAALLKPVDPATLHVFRLPARSDVELHYHDFDEYWAFIEGRPRVTLRAPNGAVRELDLEPGDLVACLRGVEHTLWADHEVVYYQYSSVLEGNERGGHLSR